MSERHRGFEVGDPNAPYQILWIHGYTGSPDAFQKTTQRLSDELNAHVLVPLLPGHGTEEIHLEKYSFDDFLGSARHFAREVFARNKPTAIIGYSFGSMLASILASENDITSLALALNPYELRFPFWLPGIDWILGLHPFWKKYLTPEDLRVRQDTFYYPDFPGTTITYIKEGHEYIEKIIPSLNCPILTLNTADDPLIVPTSGQDFLDKSAKNVFNEAHVLSHGRHALFFTPEHTTEEDILLTFLKKTLNSNLDLGI